MHGQRHLVFLRRLAAMPVRVRDNELHIYIYLYQPKCYINSLSLTYIGMPLILADAHSRCRFESSILS